MPNLELLNEMNNEFIERAQQEAEAPKVEQKKKTSAKSSKRKGPGTFMQILNGDFLTKEFMLKNLPFFFFLMFLLLISVGKGYYGKQLTKSVNDTQAELDEATGDFFDAKARLEENTQRAKLIERLERSGLKETTNPTKVIRIRKDEK